MPLSSLIIPARLTYPQIDPSAFSLGPLSVRWYGLMYLAGFVAFVMLGRRRGDGDLVEKGYGQVSPKAS